MSKFRVQSLPDLIGPSSSKDDYDDSALEGVAANVKLLLKLIQDHKDACYKQKKDGRRMLRVATMMTILDNVRSRIQNAQFGHKRSDDGDLSQADGKRSALESTGADEVEKLKRLLNASLAERKSLESMFSSLGKEKEIMSSELAKKVHELSEMDELISDLRAQNQVLAEKLKHYASSDKTSSETHAYEVLQERNRALPEHLQRCLDAYRALKRKLREALEENMLAQSTVEEMVVKVRESLVRFRSLNEQKTSETNPTAEIENEIVHLEQVLERSQTKIAGKNGLKKSGKQKLESTMSI